MDYPNKTVTKVIVLFFLCISVYLFFHNLFSEKKTQNQKGNQTLKIAVESSLEGTKGTYAIAIKNLKTGETYFNNEHESFETGSLYKLWIMATVYKQIEKDKLTEDKVLSENIANLNVQFKIDPDSAEQTKGVIAFTVGEALNQMITISHNYSALLLTKEIKLSTVAQFLAENKFNESSIGTDNSEPKSTASDILLFYEKLYKQSMIFSGEKNSNEFASPENARKMIALLKKQQLNDGLPVSLPDALEIAHKTGDIGWFKHDAGIVFMDDQSPKTSSGKRDYIIVVMSQSDFPAGAQERIAFISKAVYDYFTR